MNYIQLNLDTFSRSEINRMLKEVCNLEPMVY